MIHRLLILQKIAGFILMLFEIMNQAEKLVQNRNHDASVIEMVKPVAPNHPDKDWEENSNTKTLITKNFLLELEGVSWLHLYQNRISNQIF